MLFRAVVAAAAMATGVAGFYPYVPEYRCIDLGDCLGSEKRSDDSVSLPSFKIVKKTPKTILDPKTRVARLAERLKRKYHRDTEKRDNDYSIDFADTPTQATSAALDQDGTDYSYFSVVNFGASKTPMYLLMDTGASSTWVMGTSCTSSACKVHNTFGPADSSTLDVTANAFSISYGSGTVSGLYASDSMSFAGLDFTMTFGLANQTSNDFLNFPIDGIMGLSLVKGTNPTFMETVMDSNLLSANVFGINLSRASDDDNNGEINFGGPDTSKYTGDLSYSAVTATSGEWAIALGDVGADGKTAGLTGKTAYIDSGTSYIFAPPADAKALHDLIPNSELSSDSSTWYIPCDTDIPVQLEFNNVWYNISTADWVGGKVGSLCTSNIYPQDVIGGGDSWLCGDTFLKNVYALFDADQTRIGFAAKSTSSTASSSSVSSTTTAGTGTSTNAASTDNSSGFNGHVTTATTTGASTTASSTASAAPATTTKTQSSGARLTLGISSFSIYSVLFAAIVLAQLR